MAAPDLQIMRFVRRTWAQWTSRNPVLDDGVPAWVADRKQLFVGDGQNDFDLLVPIVRTQVDDAPPAAPLPGDIWVDTGSTPGGVVDVELVQDMIDTALAAALPPTTALGRTLMNEPDKPTARGDLGFTTGTPAADQVQLVDPNTLVHGKLLAAYAPATIAPGTVNTAAETVMGTLAWAAGDVLAGDILNMFAAWDVLNNSGAAVNFTFRIRVGSVTGTTLYTQTVSHASNANRYRWSIELKGFLQSLTNHYWAGFSGQTFVSSAEGPNGTNAFYLPSILGTADLTGPQSLVLTVQMASAAATIDFRPRFGFLTRNR